MKIKNLRFVANMPRTPQNHIWWGNKRKKNFVKIEKSTNARQCHCMKMQFPALSNVINVTHKC